MKLCPAFLYNLFIFLNTYIQGLMLSFSSDPDSSTQVKEKLILITNLK